MVSCLLLHSVGCRYAPRAPEDDPALRTQLLQRAARDQELRRSLEVADGAEMMALLHQVEAVDRDNTTWLRSVVDRRGWPGRSLVGNDGSEAAWLLVQHADADPSFQEHVLSLLSGLAAEGEVAKPHLAYLTDRVRHQQGEPQLYGTQYSAEQDAAGVTRWLPPRVEAPAELDARRAAMGLGPWKEYEARMAKSQGRAAFSWPRGPHGPD